MGSRAGTPWYLSHRCYDQGITDGANTAAGRLFSDERRPANQRAEAMRARFTQAIDAALHALESQALRTDL